MELKDYWRILKYRRWEGLVGGFLVFFGVMTFFNVTRQTLYETRGQVVMQERSDDVMIVGDQNQSALPPKYEYPMSVRLNFFKRTEVLKNVRKKLQEEVGVRRSIDQLKSAIGVNKQENKVVVLSATDPRKNVSKKILEYLVEAFRPYDLKKTSTFLRKKRDQEQEAIKRLEKEKEKIQASIEEINGKLENQFSPVAAVFPEKRLQTISSQLDDLDKQQQSFQEDRRELNRNLKFLREFEQKLDNDKKIPLDIQERFNLRENDQIAPLIEERTKVQAELTELRGKYKRNHPRLQRNKRRLKFLNKQISRKFRQILQEQQLEKIKNDLERISQKSSINLQRQEQITKRLKNLSAVRSELQNLQDELDGVETRIQEHQTILGTINSHLEARKQLVRWGIRPKSPSQVSSQKWFQSFMLSILIGLFGALGTAYLVEYFSSTIRTSKDVGIYFGMDTIATIPRIQEGPVLQVQSGDAQQAGELYHRLAVVIQSFQREIRGNTFLISSGKAGEGKSTVCLNMAGALARTGVETLVIDTDLRNPALHNYLDASREPGVTDVIESMDEGASGGDTTDVLEKMSEVEQEVMPGLSFVSAGSRTDNPLNLLNRRVVQRFFGQVRKQDRVVLCDSPPLEPLIDAAVLSEYVDGTLLVVEEQKMTRSDAAQVKRTLNQVGANVLGVILNKVEFAPEDYYYYYYDYKKVRP